jgi:hypothetical protein
LTNGWHRVEELATASGTKIPAGAKRNIMDKLKKRRAKLEKAGLAASQ